MKQKALQLPFSQYSYRTTSLGCSYLFELKRRFCKSVARFAVGFARFRLSKILKIVIAKFSKPPLYVFISISPRQVVSEAFQRRQE